MKITIQFNAIHHSHEFKKRFEHSVLPSRDAETAEWEESTLTFRTDLSSDSIISILIERMEKQFRFSIETGDILRFSIEP